MSEGNACNDDQTPQEQAKTARSMWLNPRPDMKQVEVLYRSAISSLLSDAQLLLELEAVKKRPLSTEADVIADGGCLEDWQRLCMEQLCMILCQSGRSVEAKPYLQRLGYVCRLATCVLDYPLEENNNNNNNNNDSHGSSNTNSKERTIACKVWDNFLSNAELQHLRDVFEDRNANYWKTHNYQVEPPSPYFSYIVPLTRVDRGASVTVDSQFGRLGDIVTHLHQHLLPHFPKLTTASMVEIWAHNRPHPTGHQFHFDSDNEGQGRMIKNPIMTAILYLSTSPSESPSSSSTGNNAGGPSIVTNQALVSQNLASKAYMSVSTCPGRVIAFDGSLLHGVIPGKGSHSGMRRVTLMLAFWKRIRVRPGDTPGAARPYPFPTEASKEGDWNQLLARPSNNNNTNDNNNSESKDELPSPVERNPIPLDRVYETLDGEKWTKAMGFPEYDQVFQGF